MHALRVLVAGSGDLGSRIARGLKEAGAEVARIARRERPDEPDVLALDLARPVGASIRGEFDLLVHCLSPSSRDEAGYRAVYVDAQRNLLDAVPRASRMLFVSSTAVYGEHGGDWVDEDSPCRPGGFNGRVLREAETLALSCGREALVLRLGGIYGPGREMLLRRVRSGAPLVVSDPPLYTNRIHVDDAAAATLHLVRQGARGIFNVVDDAPAPQAEVLDWLADQLGLPRLARTAGAAATDNKRVANARLHASGFAPRYPDYRAGYAESLAEGVR
jgi:nucleoside-diphosphate-sugar epimerase